MAAEKSNEKRVGIILLAAGSSSRLGRPKQLLPFDGHSLLQHSVQEALASNAQPVVIVLGANSDTLRKEIMGDNVHVVMNAEWQQGMASSIRSGVKALTEISPASEGVIVMVCDQPFVTATLLNILITAYQKTRKPIVACSYENTFGPPVFFHHSLFKELLRLKGDVGARGVVRQHIDTVEVIPFPQGIYDVDTEAGYQRVKSIGKP